MESDGWERGRPQGLPPSLVTITMLRFILLQEQHRFLHHAPAQTAANADSGGRPGPSVCAIARLLCGSARPAAPAAVNEGRLDV
jgi:hypothetical protein